MTDKKADALGCGLWLVAGIAGIVAGVFAANWAVGEFDYPRWPVWIGAFLVVSSVVTPAIFFPLLFAALPFLERKD